MSETTQILFNSPALHSLKRDQLVKLCKIHSIKANGKNVELIERLKHHALTLPNDDPLSIAARSETSSIIARPLSPSLDTTSDESDLTRHQMPRPSEQWEIVMESIQEVEETASSQGTLTSLRTIGSSQASGEFGTSNSKSSTVTSSIRAFATSIGLKRGNKPVSTVSSRNNRLQDDELTQLSIPYSAVTPATPPLNDNFTFDPKTANHTRMSISTDGQPLPGCALRPGIPAPANARLSMGLGLGAPSTPMKQQPTTTIRLVSNTSNNEADNLPSEVFRTPKLKPFATTFDLIMSPGGGANTLTSAGFWAPDASMGHVQSIYPTLTNDDLPPAVPPSPIKVFTDTNTTNKGDRLAAPGSTNTTHTPTKPDPFIFGSPLPQHTVSDNQFRTAATSVLEEMNKRLKSEGVEGVGLDLIGKLQPGAHSKEQLERLQREVKPLPARRSSIGARGEIAHKFEGLHQAEFAKMEGIDELMRRKGASVSPEKRSGLDVLPIVGKKRKSSVLGDSEELPRRPTAGPAARFTTGGRTSGATRVISNGRRAKALPGAFDVEDEEGLGEPEERREKRVKMDPEHVVRQGGDKDENTMEVDQDDQKRKEEERERAAIKRKLELSRAKRKSSVGGGIAPRRKSGRISGVAASTAKPARFGFLASAKNLVASVWNRGKTAPRSNIPKPTTTAAQNPASLTTNQEEAPKKANLLKKTTPVFVPAKTVSTVSMTNGTNNSRLSVVKDQLSQQQKPLSARSRPPIPHLVNKPEMVGSHSSNTSSRMSFATGSRTSGTSSASGNNTRSTRVSSVGTRLSSTSSASANTGVGSLGMKKHSVSRSSSMTSSRLLAPTASSLAKTKKPEIGDGLKAVAENNVVSKLDGASTIATTTSGWHRKKPSLLDAITNSPKVQRGVVSPPRSTSKSQGTTLWCPKSPSRATATPGKIFSKPIVSSTSGIPVFSQKRHDDEGRRDQGPTDKDSNTVTKPMVQRQRTLAGRKPRISRSKVIARLASQRAAASSSSSAGTLAVPGTRSGPLGNKPRSSTGAGLQKRIRSSLGAKPGRASFTGHGPSEKERNVLASAKKRARQSEYARRRSSRASSAGTGL